MTAAKVACVSNNRHWKYIYTHSHKHKETDTPIHTYTRRRTQKFIWRYIRRAEEEEKKRTSFFCGVNVQTYKSYFVIVCGSCSYQYIRMALVCSYDEVTRVLEIFMSKRESKSAKMKYEQAARIAKKKWEKKHTTQYWLCDSKIAIRLNKFVEKFFLDLRSQFSKWVSHEHRIFTFVVKFWIPFQFI